MKITKQANFILGGGITGLILGNILEDHIVIADRVGGQLNSGFKLGPRILKYTPIVDLFLKKIGIEAEPKNFTIGYYHKGYLTNCLSEEMRQIYFKKTRGAEFPILESSMSDGESLIYGWDMIEIELVKVLAERIKDRIYSGYITYIDTKEKHLWDNDFIAINYDNLISTIDSDILFNEILRVQTQIEFEKRMVYYYKILTPFDLSYDFIYVVDSPAVNRITKIDAKYCCIESNHDISEKNKIVGSRIDESASIESQIKSQLYLKEVNGIILAGRYAEYAHNVRAHNIIERFWRG